METVSGQSRRRGAPPLQIPTASSNRNNELRGKADPHLPDVVLANQPEHWLGFDETPGSTFPHLILDSGREEGVHLVE